MIDIESNTVTLGTPFTTVITVSSSTDVPSVTASVVDSGVTITPGPGTVTIAGAYGSILKTTWHWIDEGLVQYSAPTPPTPGTYKKITGVDSPPSLTAVCNYTIVSTSSTDTFVQTVTLGSFSVISDMLKNLLGSVK